MLLPQALVAASLALHLIQSSLSSSSAKITPSPTITSNASHSTVGTTFLTVVDSTTTKQVIAGGSSFLSGAGDGITTVSVTESAAYPFNQTASVFAAYGKSFLVPLAKITTWLINTYSYVNYSSLYKDILWPGFIVNLIYHAHLRSGLNQWKLRRLNHDPELNMTSTWRKSQRQLTIKCILTEKDMLCLDSVSTVSWSSWSVEDTGDCQKKCCDTGGPAIRQIRNCTIIMERCKGLNRCSHYGPVERDVSCYIVCDCMRSLG